MMNSFALKNADVERMEALYQAMKKRKSNSKYTADQLAAVASTTTFMSSEEKAASAASRTGKTRNRKLFLSTGQSSKAKKPLLPGHP